MGGSSVPSPGLQRPLGPGSWSYPGQHRGSSAPNRGAIVAETPIFFKSFSHPRPEGRGFPFFVTLGLAFPSKDIDIFIEAFNPMFLSRIIAEALGLGEERYEVFRKGDNVVFHFFVPVEVGVVSVEVMS